MNKQESLILSDEAINAIADEHLFDESKPIVYYTSVRKAIAKAEAKFLLEQLEKEGRIKHEQGFFKVTEADKKAEWSSNWEHNSDYCWLCAALREVEGK